MRNKTEDKLSKLNDTADTTAKFDPNDIEQNKMMSLLAYLGILVFVPLLAAKNSKFARYHSNQGFILLIFCMGWVIIHRVLMAIFRVIFLNGTHWRIYSLIDTVLSLIYVVFTILAVIGIINVFNGRAKELPVIGKYKLLK
jgi:uncharacterized membrane protein